MTAEELAQLVRDALDRGPVVKGVSYVSEVEGLEEVIVDGAFDLMALAHVILERLP
jgi:hypothetical protein